MSFSVNRCDGCGHPDAEHKLLMVDDGDGYPFPCTICDCECLVVKTPRHARVPGWSPSGQGGM